MILAQLLDNVAYWTVKPVALTEIFLKKCGWNDSLVAQFDLVNK